MKGRRFLILAGALALAALLVSGVVLAQGVASPHGPQDVTDAPSAGSGQALGSGFTYQGQLNKGSSPVDGACDMAFRLYDAAEEGGQVGVAITRPVTITAGLFVETLDFGSGAFTGDGRWLEIKVRCVGEGDTEYADLGRQTLTAAPYAFYALGAPWSGLRDIPDGFADGVDDVMAVVSGTNIFAGDGLTLASGGNAVTLSVNFAGSGGDYGAATAVARSDHIHDDRYYTEGELQAGGSASVHWGNLTNVPDGLDDGDDTITYTAGTGLALTGAEFSITPTYRLPQACTGGQIAKWDSGAWVCGSDDVGGGSAAWSLTGNAGTTPTVHFLGTTDDVSLTLAVNNTPALRLEPSGGTPNLIGGYSGNSIAAGAHGAVIGGGGSGSLPNHVTANYGTVGGGYGNEAGGGATIGGGRHNVVTGSYGTVGGGYDNTASSSRATVGGGYGNTASGDGATVPGGYGNTAQGRYSFAAGYRAQANHDGAFVWADSTKAEFASSGDDQFLVRASGGVTLNVASGALRLEPNATSPNLVGGHVSNTVAAGVMGTTIGGGGNITSPNYVIGNYGTVGGGLGNYAGHTGSPSDTLYATVGGGNANLAQGEGTTIGGGVANNAGSDYATVPGGYGNWAQGDYAFAAGRQARASHDGAFVWADSTGTDFYSNGADQFSVRATGGVNFQTGSANFQINGRNVWQPANVIMVAQSGGDYTSVQAAIDSISDATADNPYLVWVAPGIYNETVTMKPYVHLQGAGQEAAVITSTATTGDWPPTTATLVLTRNVSLRDLTVGNSGTGSRNTALLAMDGTTQTLVADVTARAQGAGILNNYASFLTGSGTDVTLSDVTALAENGGYNYGLYNHNGAATTLRGGSFTGQHEGSSNNHGLYNDHGAATLRGGSFTARGGNSAYGIDNIGSGATLEAEGVIALGESGSNSNGGLYNSSAAATLRGGSFTGRGGGAGAYGIHNTGGGATLEAEGVIALGESGSNSNGGLYNSSAAATLRGGSFTGRGGSNAYGAYNTCSGAILDTESITALAEDGTSNNYGLYNDGGAAATPRGGSFTGRGGGTAYGIYNDGASTTLEAKGITALAEDGTSINYGLYNHNGAAATPRGSSFTARGGSNAYGVYNTGSGATLETENATALGENASSSNYGLYNNSNVTTTLHGGSFTGHGGTNNAYGLYNDGSNATLEAESITALGEDGSSYNYALYNFYGTVRLHSGSFAARGGNYTRGIVNYGNNATLEARGVGARATSGFINNYALYNASSATTHADSSQFAATGTVHRALHQTGGTVRLGVSQLSDGANRTDGTLTCFQVYTQTYAGAYTCP